MFINVSEVQAFETDSILALNHNFASRLMDRYNQMGNNENITYPARVFGDPITDAQAQVLLDSLSAGLTSLTESMYDHYGFMVKSVTFTLEANGQGSSNSGSVMPFNVNVSTSWAAAITGNVLYLKKEWALNPMAPTPDDLFHEFGHLMTLRHIDPNDGSFPRSTMDGSWDDMAAGKYMFGGDDLAGVIHMWRYSNSQGVPYCPEFYTHETVGVTGVSYPDAVPFPKQIWRCDVDRIDINSLPLVNRGSGKNLELSGKNNGTDVSFADQSGNTNQQWNFEADDDGAYRIRNVSTDMCMEVTGSSLLNGAIIEQQPCNLASSEDAKQKFYPIADGHGYYSIRAELSGRVLAVSGDKIIQERPDGSHSQRWSLKALSTTDCNGDAGGNAFIDGCNICVEGNTGKSKIVTGIPDGYIFLGNEGDTKTLPAKSDVVYGHDCSFTYLYGVSGSIAINNATFGDPAPGQVKKAYYKTIDVVTSIDNETIVSDFNIYPNPAQNQVNIEGEFKGWILTNAFGAFVKRGAEKSIDVAALSPGLYYLNVDGEVMKFIKI